MSCTATMAELPTLPTVAGIDDSAQTVDACTASASPDAPIA
jgi:hypothetical protein